MPTEDVPFRHAQKPNNTFNTTCPLCGRIIGDANTEGELGAIEAKHSCQTADLMSKQLSTKA